MLPLITLKYVVWRQSVGVYHRCEVKQRRVNQVVSSMGVQHGCTALQSHTHTTVYRCSKPKLTNTQQSSRITQPLIKLGQLLTKLDAK